MDDSERLKRALAGEYCGDVVGVLRAEVYRLRGELDKAVAERDKLIGGLIVDDDQGRGVWAYVYPPEDQCGLVNPLLMDRGEAIDAIREFWGLAPAPDVKGGER